VKPRYGEFQVVGKRAYRDHPHGTVFQARLERNAEGRAIARGDLLLLRVVEPCLQPGSYTFPTGWLTATNHEAGKE
jgi:hypothetical protein